jgi:serine/threonine protein kinase
MRLLELNNHGEASLSKYLINNIPPYAILSHTWGEDDEEVTFQDLTQGVGKNKAGYGKIRFCGKQAAKDGLQYIWIDTCCIDKSNSTELSELWQGGDQTTKLDIYGLGATIIEALGGFPDPAKRPATWQLWHHHLQDFASERPIASMLASSPNERPTAHQIICTLFPDELPPMEWTRIGSTGLSPKIPQPTPRRDVVSRRTSDQIPHAQSLSSLQTRDERKVKNVVRGLNLQGCQIKHH